MGVVTETGRTKVGAGLPPFFRGWSKLAAYLTGAAGTGLGAQRFLGFAGEIKIQSLSVSVVSMMSQNHENELEAGDNATLGVSTERKLTQG